MESHLQQQQHQQAQNDQDSSSKGSFLCRQSSTRWSPTTDQIRILKDLYYNNGVRSPSADQIQRISSRLRQYGKIEGKNVFYWFQNHKARERQKKMFSPSTTDLHVSMQRPTSITLANNKFPTNITPDYSPSSAGVLTIGQIGNYGYGSITMEKSFRDCSISACVPSASESLSHNLGWVGVDPAYSSSCSFFEPKRFMDGIHEEGQEDEDYYYDEEEEEADTGPQMETLSLFPMHGEEINGFCSNMKLEPDKRYSRWYRSEDGYTGARASLELSLNSYTGRSRDSI
ncbi:hypothetical protein GQ457_05G006210 [Hibiscus cannabinus]